MLAESTGCQARRQAVAAWGAGDRTEQQEGGSQQWLKVTCWEVSELELSLLLQNKLCDQDILLVHLSFSLPWLFIW